MLGRYSDTVRKRLTVMIHTPGFDDLALCTFWLGPQQALEPYAMRMHTTKDWTDATVSFYAADVNAPGSTGAYQLDDVSLTYRPAFSAAKTECVDPMAPTSGGSVTGPMLENGDFSNGTTAWTLEGGLASQVSNNVLEFHRNGAGPAIKQFTNWAADPDQRLAAMFELGNTSSTRQRVTITFKDQTNGDLTNCVFWLAANRPKQLYAMTGYAGIAWANPGLTVEPATSGGSVAWLQFDTVTMVQTTQAVLGTECFEPGSFVVENWWPVDPGAPAPAPAPAPAAESPIANALGAVGRFGVQTAEEDGSRVPHVPELSGPSAPPLEAVTVMVMGTGTGSVASSPGGLTCGPYYVACTGWFAEGSTITLTATPEAGQVFVGWTGACAGVDPCALTIVGTQGVGALFGAPLQFYHVDVLGSVRMITDATGNVVTRQDYLAFGEQTGALTGDPRRFTGKELDPETALQYFGARYYRSESGRFTSVDPRNALSEAGDEVRFVAFIGNPQNWNRYGYVLNNPLKFIDPDGRNPFAVLGGIGAAVYGTWQVVQNVVNDRPWHENVGVEASKGLLVGGTLGLAAPAVVADGTVTMGAVTSAALNATAIDRAMNAGGPTVQLFTKLTQAPAVGRGLSTAGGEGAQALAAAARPDGTMYVAQIPQALIKLLQRLQLVEIRQSITNGVQGVEYRFYPGAMEYLAKYFKEIGK